MIGKTLSHYEILAPLGAGGMGEVYRARDTKLERDVAIKVLPDDLAADPDRLARFEREAKLLAALSHTNIGAIYGLDSAAGVHFLVLELIEGETLEQRLRKGAIPVPEALDIARQIAEALEAAHDAGIIHRDVKPANVLLAAKGGVKVLDFGIAKSTLLDSASNAKLTEQATSLTVDGTLMGTPPYMAPEQIRGEEIDKRADIWAFGCVVYEMLTGRGAFVRETVADTLVAVLEAEPDWGALPNATSREIGLLLRRCLRKDPNHRLRDAGDARIEIAEVANGALVHEASAGHPAASPQPIVAWAIAAVATAIALAAVIGNVLGGGTQEADLAGSSSAVPGAVVRFSFDIPTGLSLSEPLRISGDGKRILLDLYPPGTGSNLYLRELTADEVVVVEGPDNPNGPMFSPDGNWVSFFAAGELWKVPITGGRPESIAPVSRAVGGAAWTAADDIVFGTQGRLYRVAAAAGGEVQELVEEDWWITDSLPGSPVVLGAIVGPTTPSADEATVAAYRLTDGRTTILHEGGYAPHYVDPGYLVFARGGALYAAAFDPDELRLLSPAVRVLDDVRMRRATGGNHQFDISDNGTLVYAAGGTDSNADLVRGRQDGTVVGPVGEEEKAFTSVYASPDGNSLIAMVGWQAHQLWLFDRGSWTLLVQEDSHSPVWMPDSASLIFQQRGDMFRLDLPFAGQRPTQLTNGDHPQAPAAVSPDGRELIFVENRGLASSGRHLRVLQLEDGGEPFDLIAPEYNASGADFHPSGDFIAFTSDREGQEEVYVAPYPQAVRVVKVSTNGGREARWSADGKQLFYRGLAINYDELWTVEVNLDPAISPGVPRLLAKFPFVGTSVGRRWDVMPDGSLVFVRTPAPRPPVRSINVVLNWVEELKRLVPTGR